MQECISCVFFFMENDSNRFFLQLNARKHFCRLDKPFKSWLPFYFLFDHFIVRTLKISKGNTTVIRFFQIWWQRIPAPSGAGPLPTPLAINLLLTKVIIMSVINKSFIKAVTVGA